MKKQRAWAIESRDENSEELIELLSEGWEPFGVTLEERFARVFEDGTGERPYMARVFHLRNSIKVDAFTFDAFTFEATDEPMTITLPVHWRTWRVRNRSSGPVWVVHEQYGEGQKILLAAGEDLAVHPEELPHETEQVVTYRDPS